MKLAIPDNGDLNLQAAVQRLAARRSAHKISEIYGKVTKNVHLGSGRTNARDFAREEAVARVNSFRKMEIDYNWSINDIVPRSDILENRSRIIEELKWIEQSGIRSITVADYALARLAQVFCPSVAVSVSFFAGVDSPKRLLQWAKLSNVKTINTDRSTYRNIPLLEELVKLAQEHGIGIRVIANLGCMSDCIQTEGHAIIKSLASINGPALHCRPYTFYCMRHLLENPREFLQLPIIRPEDLSVYEDIGVDSVKLVDRSQTTSWIERVVGYYLDGSYEGNILDLTCNFTTFGLERKSNAEVAEINMATVAESRAGVREYRKILPELLGVNIDNKAFNPLSCNNTCSSCSGQCNSSALKYDEARRQVVLAQLARLEKDYLFAQVPLSIPPSARPLSMPASTMRPIACDMVLIESGEVLLVKRGGWPWKGEWALPGGCLDDNEILESCAVREMKEETGVDVELIKLTGVYSDPARHPRSVITAGWLVKRIGGEVKGADDADEARWFPLNSLPQLAGDHAKILADAVAAMK